MKSTKEENLPIKLEEDLPNSRMYLIEMPLMFCAALLYPLSLCLLRMS